MAILDVRPVWALSDGEMLAQLDVLHAEIARLQTQRLELIAGIEQSGYAKEIGARDTVQLLAFRHRLDAPAVRRDVKLAKALPKYPLVSAALPDPAAPTSTDGSTQYGDPATSQHGATGHSNAADQGEATDRGETADLGDATDQGNATDLAKVTDPGEATDQVKATDPGKAAGCGQAARLDAVVAQTAGPSGDLGPASNAATQRSSALVTDGSGGVATEELSAGSAEGRGSADGGDGREVGADGDGRDVGNGGDGSGGAGCSGAGADGAGSGGAGSGGAGSGGAGSGGAGSGGVRPVLLHPAQAEAIVSALEQIPARAMVPAEDLLEAEAQMVEAARHLSPGELRRLGAKIRDLLDTDGPEPAEDAAAAREALWLKTAPKGVRFGGFLANENAELLRTLIGAGAGPRKTPDGARDPRSRPKRQADALVDILNAAAGSGNAVPGHGGIAPHLNMTMDFFDLKKAGADATGDVHFGDGLSAAAVRRLACDAGVIPIVLGSNSEPLDVGREERFVTKAIRRALIARDKGCVICSAPPDHCDVHHLVSWIDGGETAVGNLVLMCKPDHREVHHGDWVVQIVDGVVVVTRPGWAEPGHPDPGHPDPWGGGPARPDDTLWESGGPGDPAQGESPASESPASGSRAGGSPASESGAGRSQAGVWPQGGRGSGAGERAWPWSGDPPPLLTKEAADRLNPWGDYQPSATPNRREEATATTETSPWGDGEDASPGP